MNMQSSHELRRLDKCQCLGQGTEKRESRASGHLNIPTKSQSYTGIFVVQSFFSPKDDTPRSFKKRNTLEDFCLHTSQNQRTQTASNSKNYSTVEASIRHAGMLVIPAEIAETDSPSCIFLLVAPAVELLEAALLACPEGAGDSDFHCTHTYHVAEILKSTHNTSHSDRLQHCMPHLSSLLLVLLRYTCRRVELCYFIVSFAVSEKVKSPSFLVPFQLHL